MHMKVDRMHSESSPVFQFPISDGETHSAFISSRVLASTPADPPRPFAFSEAGPMVEMRSLTVGWMKSANM